MLPNKFAPKKAEATPTVYQVTVNYTCLPVHAQSVADHISLLSQELKPEHWAALVKVVESGKMDKALGYLPLL